MFDYVFILFYNLNTEELRMPKKLLVNKDACIGCGLCNATHPEAFQFDDEGKAEVVGEVEESLVEECINGCPVGAISE